MDFVKDAAAGSALLALQLSGPTLDFLGLFPPQLGTPKFWGDACGFFVLYLVARLHDRFRVRRRVRAVLKSKAVTMSLPNAQPDPNLTS